MFVWVANEVNTFPFVESINVKDALIKDNEKMILDNGFLFWENEC
jgi:hypothetical protein